LERQKLNSAQRKFKRRSTVPWPAMLSVPTIQLTHYTVVVIFMYTVDVYSLTFPVVLRLYSPVVVIVMSSLYENHGTI